MRTLAPSSSLNHSAHITDVCFGPGLAATSSANHTVKLWDVNQVCSVFFFSFFTGVQNISFFFFIELKIIMSSLQIH